MEKNFYLHRYFVGAIDSLASSGVRSILLFCVGFLLTGRGQIARGVSVWAHLFVLKKRTCAALWGAVIRLEKWHLSSLISGFIQADTRKCVYTYVCVRACVCLKQRHKTLDNHQTLPPTFSFQGIFEIQYWKKKQFAEVMLKTFQVRPVWSQSLF